MDTLKVELGTRSYPIYIGRGLLGQAHFVTPHLKGRQVLIVSNETVAPLYLDKILNALNGLQTATVILPDGEEYKTLTVLNQIFDGLLQHHFDRHSTLIALGGGVVGDMTGFAAACYQRGVAFIQIPTTLLAQVDASVGGKTGVNHPLGKNMVGAFYQPQCVIIDTDTLQTLADREFHSGLAEVIKYGLINDLNFFNWLEEHTVELLARDPEVLRLAIKCSCEAKANIVAQDERESGIRALLNLGHTFAHALETASNYSQFLHGEAVAIGLCLSAHLSAQIGWLTESDVQRIKQLLAKMQLPTVLPDYLTSDQLMTSMRVDKKVQGGQIRLVLLREIGQAVLTADYSSALLLQTLAQSERKP